MLLSFRQTDKFIENDMHNTIYHFGIIARPLNPFRNFSSVQLFPFRFSIFPSYFLFLYFPSIFFT